MFAEDKHGETIYAQYIYSYTNTVNRQTLVAVRFTWAIIKWDGCKL